MSNLEATILLANLLTHNNIMASAPVKAEVVELTQALETFAAVFTCSKCDQIVRYHRSAKLVKCSCSTGGKEWHTK